MWGGWQVLATNYEAAVQSFGGKGVAEKMELEVFPTEISLEHDRSHSTFELSGWDLTYDTLQVTSQLPGHNLRQIGTNLGAKIWFSKLVVFRKLASVFWVNVGNFTILGNSCKPDCYIYIYLLFWIYNYIVYSHNLLLQKRLQTTNHPFKHW